MRPVGLPCPTPTKSYWQTPPDDIADLETSPLPQETDIVIIGSGITGAGIAWNLFNRCPASEPPPAIVMLEARQACSGATGRNGGHTKAASYRSFLGHADDLGTDAACQIARMELSNIRAVHAFAREHGINCESRPCRTVDAIYDPVQWKQAHDAIKAMRDAMPDDDASSYSFLSAQDLDENYKVAADGVCGGVEYEAGSISAYKFTVGVLKLCLAKGLNLQTHTPATTIERISEVGCTPRWLIGTPSGSIFAKRVVLATNGYTAAIHGGFHGIIVPTRGQITAQRPGDGMPAEGLDTTYSFIYENGFEYMVPKPPETTHAGDIIIGGGLVKAPCEGLSEYGTTDDASLNPIITQYLHQTTPRYFGKNWGRDHPEGRVRAEWSGIMGFSPDSFPFVGQMPGEEGLWVAASFQGHGMVFCWKCAEALTEMMHQTNPQAPPTWFPAAFLVTEKRLGRRFEGVRHTTAGGSSELDQDTRGTLPS